MGKPIWGKWANDHGIAQLHRQFHRTWNGENPSSGYRDMGSASLAAARPTARPPTRTVTTIPLQPGGLRGKKETIREFKPLSRLIGGTRNNLAKVAKNVPCIIFDLSWTFSARKSVRPFSIILLTGPTYPVANRLAKWISRRIRLVGKTSIMKSLPVPKWCGIFIILWLFVVWCLSRTPGLLQGNGFYH